MVANSLTTTRAGGPERDSGTGDGRAAGLHLPIDAGRGRNRPAGAAERSRYHQCAEQW